MVHKVAVESQPHGDELSIRVGVFGESLVGSGHVIRIQALVEMLDVQYQVAF